MTRLHVHIAVAELAPSVAFYSALFGAAPTVSKPDYAKWLLDDPRVNFAISAQPDNVPGVNHLGIQAETEEELAAIHARLGAANIASQRETGARCCYAESDKHWAADPTGVVWEAYRTMRSIAVYGGDRGVDVLARLPATPGSEPAGCGACG